MNANQGKAIAKKVASGNTTACSSNFLKERSPKTGNTKLKAGLLCVLYQFHLIKRVCWKEALFASSEIGIKHNRPALSLKNCFILEI